MSKVKEFVCKHKKEIALVTSTAVVVAGGMVLYMLKGKHYDLVKILESYDPSGDTNTRLVEDITNIADSGTFAFPAKPNIRITMEDIGTVVDAVKTSAEDMGKTEAVITGVVVFCKE